MICALTARSLALGVAAAAAFGAEQQTSLINAPGHEVVQTNCSACHSLDYVRINSPFLDRKGWQSEVDKMIKAYGADISPQDAAAIVDYLTRNYGTGS
jgi:mono/diheme cytochrome c family protein